MKFELSGILIILLTTLKNTGRPGYKGGDNNMALQCLKINVVKDLLSTCIIYLIGNLPSCSWQLTVNKKIDDEKSPVQSDVVLKLD